MISRSERNRADIEDSKLYYTNRGIEQGIEQGEVRKQQEIISNMLKLGLSFEEIAKLTNSSLSDVEKLSN
ncbi:MAG: hypothetical protein LBN08_01725 [Lactobacillales bacterium]|nr:hypothetical protein [Lactobacillales bacterium]